MEIRHTPSKRHRPTVLVAMHPETMTALARFRLGSHSEPLGATGSDGEPLGGGLRAVAAFHD